LKKNKIKNIAIITARSGSKRIKNKNIKLFFGKPVIFYSINALKKTKIFDEIIISTNSNQIIKICKRYGINFFLKRNKYYSQDKVGSISVINFCLKQLAKKKIFPKYICCQYPASPLTSSKNIIKAYRILKKKKLNFIFTAVNLLKKKNIYKNLVRIKQIKKKRGILNNEFLDAGQFWYAKNITWKKSKSVYDKNSFIIPIKEKFSDINTMTDWKKVKKIFKSRQI
jgi:pseudaminic acid cytidylyltransferase